MRWGIMIFSEKKEEVGSIADICLEDRTKNKDTFAGDYAKIIQRLKTIQPEAKFFLVTMPRDTENPEDENEKKKASHAALLHEMAKLFDNTYVIDLNQYGPVQDAEFRKLFFHNGHMTACGYKLAADVIMSYIDYLIRHHMEDFKLAGMIGYKK